MKDQQNSFSRAWLPVLLWMIFIFILSSVPGKEIPDLSIPQFHKVVHFFEYTVLGGLWLRALLLSSSRVAGFKASILAWALTALFALSDEWHQTFVSGRSGELDDVLFDVCCAVLGILLYFSARSRLIRKTRTSVGS
ncbi:MAG: VanZ family protein [Candidatus Omnitrophota bacterium]